MKRGVFEIALKVTYEVKRLGEILPSLLWLLLYPFAKILNLLWRKFYAIRQIFNALNSQILKII